MDEVPRLVRHNDDSETQSIILFGPGPHPQWTPVCGAARRPERGRRSASRSVDPVREKLLDAEDKRLDQAAGGATTAPSAAPKEEPYTISILPEKLDKDCIVPQDNTTMQVLKSFEVPEYDAQPHRVFERIPFIRTGMWRERFPCCR